MTRQLTIGGREIDHPLPSAQSKSPLTPAQRAILREIGENGQIRSCEAGAIVHQCRKGAQIAADHGRLVEYLTENRKYAASDGLEALKRLEARGFVTRVAPGLWRSV